MYKNSLVRLPYAGDLEPGAYSLGVPTAKGAILLGGTKVRPDARITVLADDDLIGIAREDGEPIQIVERRVPYNPTEPTEDIPALVQPVDEIWLGREDTDNTAWTVGIEENRDFGLIDAAGFQKFASTVVEHALSKQIMQARVAAMRQIHHALLSMANFEA